MELAGIGFFLEIAIVGAGATAWFVLATLTVAGYRWISPEFLEAPGLLILALPLVFILGIIVDELGDRVIEIPKGGLKEKIRRTVLKDDASKIVPLRRAAYESEYERQALEYARRRLRIARGWVVNSVALLISLNAFVLIRLPASVPTVRISVWGTAATALLFAGSLFATYQLLTSEYKILRDSAAATPHRDVRPERPPSQDA